MVKTRSVGTRNIPQAEKRDAKAVRAHPTWSAGDCAFQGDVIFIALRKFPTSAKARVNRQLVDGTSKGSRHVVSVGNVFDANKAEVCAAIREVIGKDIPETYIGPVLSGACTVTHPEHAHQIFPDHTCTAVVYQRNLDAEEREVRSRD